ncbi:UbiH 2-polyprenyl-6-methoxyphenol hydroxylase and related FAD-dependent oxidoreductases [Burkholderiaceae bacterium]
MTHPKILIAGGGIGGLATALTLLQNNIDVDVYEQASELREVGAGIQISPNGNRVLDHMGVFEPLKSLSSPTQGKEIRLWNTGQTWPLFDLGKAAIDKYGYPYMTAFRPHLLQVLAEAVQALKPDAIHLNARCNGFEQSDAGVTLHFDGAASVSGDALIGADGLHSKIRAGLFGAAPPDFTGMVSWRALIPMEVLPEHLARPVATNWVGPGGHVVHYPLHAGKVMNFVGTLEGNTWSGPPWVSPATVDAALTAFEGWHEDVRTMIRHAPSFLKWALCGRPFLDHWSQGRVTLMGDACHPTLPFLAQGAVFTLEDAVVLQRCIRQDAHDLPTALQRYEAARQERAYRMVRGASDNTSRFHNPILANAEQGVAFIEREWQQTAIGSRYDWIFNYNAITAEI